MGTLVDAPGIRPTAHIFVGSKAPWFTITDELPQYEGHVTCLARTTQSPDKHRNDCRSRRSTALT